MKTVILIPFPETISCEKITDDHVVVLIIGGRDKYVLKHEPEKGYIFRHTESSNLGAYGYSTSIKAAIEQVYRCESSPSVFNILAFDNYDEFVRWYVNN